MSRTQGFMRRAVTAWIWLSLAAIPHARAQAVRSDEPYPSKPIRLVLPQPAGGAVDLIARTLGDRLSEQTRQPVIVDNQPGANGGLAAGQVVRATPDGYTLLMAVDTNLVVNPSLYPNLAYDPFRDFVPISIIAKHPPGAGRQLEGGGEQRRASSSPSPRLTRAS